MEVNSNQFFIGSLLFFSLLSCGISRPRTSNVRPDEITRLALFYPTSKIFLVESGNRQVFNDTLTKQMQEMQVVVAEKLGKKIHLTEEIFPSDSLTIDRINKEKKHLLNMVLALKNISNITLPATIDSLLETRKTRFGLFIYCTGYTRSSKNYAGQVAAGVIMGVMSMGHYYYLPAKGSSVFYALIVDAQDNNITFYRKSKLDDREPLNEETIRIQFMKLFDGYFLEKKWLDGI